MEQVSSKSLKIISTLDLAVDTLTPLGNIASENVGYLYNTQSIRLYPWGRLESLAWMELWVILFEN